MMNVRNNKELREKLNKGITLPNNVENKMNDAYQQIRAKSSRNNSAIVDYRIPKLRRWLTVAATFAVVSLTTLGVLAATGFFSSKATVGVDTEGNKAITYKYDINYETVPGVFEATVGYLPEGYEEFEQGKYYRSKEEWISIFVNSTASLEWGNETKQIAGTILEENITIAGMEADILSIETTESNQKNKLIILRNELEGYEVEVYGGEETSLDELKKFAEGMTITRIGDDTYMTEEEKILMQIKKGEISQEEGQAVLEEKGMKDELTR